MTTTTTRHEPRNAARRGGTKREATDAPTAPGTTIRGTLKVNPRGFGFVCPTGSVDAFVKPQLLRGFLADDIVDADVRTSGDKTDVVSMRLVARSRTSVVGVVNAGRDGAPPTLALDPFVANSAMALTGATPAAGTVATASLEKNPGRLRGRVVIEHGPVDSVDAIRARVMSRWNLRSDDDYSAPTDSIDAFAAAPDAAGDAPRRDLRDLATITIDGASSRDLDDAISAVRGTDGTVRLYVHIADVAAAVPAGSELDRAALCQSTSVYLPGWNRPMLPRELSEGSCSLLAGVERNTLTVEMCVNASGAVSGVDLYESVIRSDARLTYDDAERFLTGRDRDTLDASSAAQLTLLRSVAARLDVARRSRGGIDSARFGGAAFEITAADGVACAVEASNTPVADNLIERCMVAANEAVAGWLVARSLPGVYRTHTDPTASRDRIVAFAEHLGLDAHLPEQLDPLTVAALLAQIDMIDSPAARVGSFVVSAGLGRALYSSTPDPHFGLGSEAYVHFTSPIRRYADLAVHRIVKAYLRGERQFTGVDAWLEQVVAATNRDSFRAGRAERDARALMWLTTMDDGSRHTGTVVDCGRHGVRVLLDGSGVSGTLPYSSWGPGQCDEHGLTVRDTQDNIVVAIGDSVAVEVHTSDLVLGNLTLVLTAGMPAAA